MHQQLKEKNMLNKKEGSHLKIQHYITTVFSI